MSKKLKLCPFCGGEAFINYETMVDDRRIYWAQIICGKCHCRSCGNWSNSYENAEKKEIKAWNTRKPMDRIVERLEEAESLVPVNRVPDDIIKNKPKELGQLMAFSEAIEIVKEEGGIE